MAPHGLEETHVVHGLGLDQFRPVGCPRSWPFWRVRSCGLSAQKDWGLVLDRSWYLLYNSIDRLLIGYVLCQEALWANGITKSKLSAISKWSNIFAKFQNPIDSNLGAYIISKNQLSITTDSAVSTCQRRGRFPPIRPVERMKNKHEKRREIVCMRLREIEKELVWSIFH